MSVKTDQLVKVFSGVEVIRNCQMTVRQGSIYALLGANGAGKTTIFKMLTGLLSPTSGMIEVLGLNVADQRERMLRKIGSLIETPVFYEHLSARENLSLHLAYLGVTETNVLQTLDKVGLSDTASQPVSQFSLGMRQRLAIARAIVHNPELLILDEPLNGMDPSGILEMRELFVDLVKQHGITILMSSHLLREVEQIADTVGIVVNGVLEEEASLSRIKHNFSGLEEYYFHVIDRGGIRV
ncbi:ABC transporter ATP-binding protein [Bacillus sp. NPDC077027]|uniref:ABC transporter ATP-binding protein n=1 Tax=Bacillus sp. NPDC077027 TaxID=3390548 RepID=UPI003CFC3D41